MKFISPRTDYAFKKIFGSQNSKDILLSFLNATLNTQEHNRILDLDILDPWQAPKIKGLKDTFVDVKAHTAEGKEVIIEMQVINLPGLQKRILYNLAKSYANQLPPGSTFTALNPVIALTIVDFILFPETEQHLTTFLLKEKEKHFVYNGDLELVFIELPKFNKTEHTLTTLQDKWVYFLQKADSLEVIPETLAEDKALCHAFEMAERIQLTPEELELVIAREGYITSQKSALEQAEHKGIEQGMKEGIEKGREEGREEGMKEAVQRMVDRMGISEEEAKKVLGM